MLSLVSRRSPRLTGTRLSLNCVTGTRPPSSKTSKSSLARSVMSRPFASVTVTVTWTVSMPPLNIGLCAPARSPKRKKAKDTRKNLGKSQAAPMRARAVIICLFPFGFFLAAGSLGYCPGSPCLDDECGIGPNWVIGNADTVHDTKLRPKQLRCRRARDVTSTRAVIAVMRIGASELLLQVCGPVQVDVSGEHHRIRCARVLQAREETLPGGGVPIPLVERKPPLSFGREGQPVAHHDRHLLAQDRPRGPGRCD